MTFPQRLRMLRERKGVKRAVMSELCGLASTAVRRYERGELMPTAKSLEAMAEYLGVTMDYLWRGENDGGNTESCDPN